MHEETSKLPDHSAASQAAYHIAVSRSLPALPSTPLTRLLKRMEEIFNPPQSADGNLSGRISELQTTADLVLTDLVHFKNDCKSLVDTQLFVVICSLVDPIIKELTRLQTETKRNGGAPQQVKIYSRYSSLIDKARVWIVLRDNQVDGPGIQRAVIERTIEEFQARIKRDIQFVEDYLTHALEGIETREELKVELKSQIAPTLEPAVLRLEQLGKESELLKAGSHHEFTPDSLMIWRSTADRTRENMINAALHAVDSFLSDFSPIPAKEKESESTLLLLAQLVHLEEKVLGVSELVRHTTLSRSKRGDVMAMLDRLEEEAHELNRNLRLTHEHGERVQKLLDTILKFRTSL